LFTPNNVAAMVFRQRGLRSILVLGTQGVVDALRGDGISACVPGDAAADTADAVYVAWHPDCTMTDIHAACEAVLRGAAAVHGLRCAVLRQPRRPCLRL
jgi:4-nitrophenyl phosphatase